MAVNKFQDNLDLQMNFYHKWFTPNNVETFAAWNQCSNLCSHSTVGVADQGCYNVFHFNTTDMKKRDRWIFIANWINCPHQRHKLFQTLNGRFFQNYLYLL